MQNHEIIAGLTGLGIALPSDLLAQSNAAGDDPGFILSMLMETGIGAYDYDTGRWTPSSSCVYAFDTEVFDIENMYHLFLQGVASIVSGFEPACINESIEELADDAVPPPFDPMSGPVPEGKTTVSFELNGKSHQCVMDFYGDWFNDEAITWVNGILEQEGFSGRLHPFFDGMQGLILFYGDEAYGQKLHELIPDLFA